MDTNTLQVLRAVASLALAVKPEDADESAIISSANAASEFMGLPPKPLLTVGDVRAAVIALDRDREASVIYDGLAAECAILRRALVAIFMATNPYADGAPDASAHDKLCNEISSLVPNDAFIKEAAK